MNNNDFENGRQENGMQDVNSPEQKPVNDTEENKNGTKLTPDSQAEKETYSQTYTPSENGYTQQTFKTTPQNNYSPYGNGNHNSYNNGGYSYRPQKKKSKLPVIAACVAVLLIFAGMCMSVGFFIANSTHSSDTDFHSVYNIPNNSNDNDNYDTDTSKNETEIVTDTPDSELKAPGSSSATIQKNDNAADTTVNTNYKAGEPMSKKDAAALVKDSVVEITTEKLVTGSYFNQYVESGAGSGVIIASEGYIVTNNHVIKDASSVKIRLTNGNEYTAELIGTDASTDIALLKIEPTEKLTVATLGSSASLSVAEDVLVIGNPLGELGGSVSSGIVSALAREIAIDGENMTLIQTNAAVNPGNSGGGMFNLSGELVGIVNAKSVGTDIEGLGFAIPIDTAYEIVLQLMDYGYVKGRIDHGLELIDITDIFTAASYHVNAYGVYVYESKYTDDIKNGDRITSMNGCEITTSTDVKSALKDCKVGDVIDVTVARSGKLVNVKLTLREYVPENTGNVSFG